MMKPNLRDIKQPIEGRTAGCSVARLGETVDVPLRPGLESRVASLVTITEFSW